MSSFSIESMREDHPNQSDEEAAESFARENGYIAIVKYKSRGATDFSDIGGCSSEDEIQAYFESPYCIDPMLVYDGRSHALQITEERVLNASCASCGMMASRKSLSIGAGNDFYICPKCGMTICARCYPRLPLTASPGYGKCPDCLVRVQRAIPGFYGSDSGESGGQ
jgi:hypothetical protein